LSCPNIHNNSIKYRKMEKIRIHTIIEIAGSPKKHVEDTINKVIEIITKNEKLKILKKEIAEPTQVELPKELKNPQKVEIFSTFTELEIEFQNLDDIMQFCFTFMPSSLEILEPEKITINQKQLEDSLNDLLGRLHEHSKIIMEYEAMRRQILSAKMANEASAPKKKKNSS